MPVYNNAEYIEYSIKSIINQSYKEFEFLIVDDGSTDKTEEIVNSFKDSRIIYKKIEKNSGTSAALNFGLKIANGDWIARIDADDLNAHNRLDSQIKFIEDNPDYDVISSWSIYFKNPNKILFSLQEPIEHDEIYEYLNLHNPLNQSAVFYKKERILQAGYDENFKNNEDFELFHRIRDQVRFYIIPEYLVYTRIRKDSKSYSQSNKNIYEFLFPEAFRNLMNSQSRGRSFYWASNTAWVNFFYGDKRKARNYLYNSFSWKNVFAYMTTFLPENLFQRIIESRIKYRVKGLFENKSEFKKELNKLLS
jgi:glycosyltransferase involved in cell wall biosynthesis